jgi:hypothetical protein
MMPYRCHTVAIDYKHARNEMIQKPSTRSRSPYAILYNLYVMVDDTITVSIYITLFEISITAVY